MLNKNTPVFIMSMLFSCYVKENDGFRFFNRTIPDLNLNGSVWNGSQHPYSTGNGKLPPVHYGPRPVYYDWREDGYVSPVKNQLTCNACWAFSIVANIESHYKIYKGTEVRLSEQFLIDCDMGSSGCSSSSIVGAFADIVGYMQMILDHSQYPDYEGRQSECRVDHGVVGIPVVGFKRVFPDEDVMADYIFQYGPLSAAINSASMANYTNGIDEPDHSSCSPKELNHAVLIVGYNVYVDPDSGKETPFWIIKNSWGEEWGDKGFYYLVRGKNACGIASDVSFGFVI